MTRHSLAVLLAVELTLAHGMSACAVAADMSTVNGNEIPARLARLQDISIMLDAANQHGNRILITKGTLFPTGPGVVARELPESNPVRQVALEFTDRYEAQHGANTMTQFAGDAMGAWMLLDNAVARALKTGAKPSTIEFRQALREALENTQNLIVPNGVLNVTPVDHQGFDQRARVMATIKVVRRS